MLFAKYKASFDDKYRFSIKGHNSIVSAAKQLVCVLYKDRR